MKKQLLLFILALLPMLAMADDSGKCGDNVTYYYSSSTQTLTIQGTGEMYDYYQDLRPWDTYKTDIKKIVIKNGVTSIKSQAFLSCSGLTSVTIPNSVTSIGYEAFFDCSNLNKIVIPEIAKWCSVKIEPLALPTKFHIYSDEVTEITSLDIPEGVTSINAEVFNGCAWITSVSIPNTVTSIGLAAFQSCSGLTSFTIPNSVTSIEDYALRDCSGLTSVTIGSGVTSIGQDAFCDCDGLTSVTFHCNNVGTWFKGFTSIKEVVIGSEVTSIEDYAFYNCIYLTSVTINSNAILSKAYTSSSNLSNIFGSQVKQYIIGNSVTSVGKYAFYNCSGLTSVTFHCNNVGTWFKGFTSIKEVVIGSEVTSIENSAFSGCSKLASVTIGSGVTSIGSYAFNGCSGLKKVIVPDIAAWCGINFVDETANPLYYVHHLYSDNNTEITKLVIPDGVTSIGSYAFSGWSVLPSVTIGSGVTSIGGYAFSGCSGLTSVTIGSGVTSIGGSAFYKCSRLTSIDIPNSVTSIGDHAFQECSGLTSVTIPNSVTSIGNGAFDGCSELTSVTIPISVTNIGEWAFGYCSGLTSITIPNSVTSIGDYAFRYCSGLQSVYNNAKDVFTINQNTFNDATYSSATLYVPTGMKSTYEETPWWLSFNKIEEYDFPTGINALHQSKDVKVVDAYQINGLKTGSMQKGLNILKMSDGTTIKVVK